MKKEHQRHLLYLPVLRSPELYRRALFYPPENKKEMEKSFDELMKNYEDLLNEYCVDIVKFQKQRPVHRVFVNDFDPFRFKEELVYEIYGNTGLAEFMEYFLDRGASLEIVESPGWWKFEDFLRADNRERTFDYQMYEYLDKYLAEHKRSGRLVSFLTDRENTLNLGLEQSILDEFMFEGVDGEGNCKTGTTRIFPLKSSGYSAMQDVRGKISAEGINRGLKQGENGVAFLHPGDTPLTYFRDEIPGAEIHCNYKLGEKSRELFRILSELLFAAELD